MCTLTIFHHNNEVIITMNRDEQRNRPEAQNLYITNEHCFPVDQKSQGTWFGLNNHGITIALLNRYQEQHLGTVAHSRGHIIPTLLPCTDIPSIEKTLRNGFTIKNINPFDCIAVSREQILHASWNGKALNVTQKELNKPFFISSSSERLSEVVAYRQNVFNNFIQSPSRSEKTILHDLHMKEDESDSSSAIMMARPKTHTKSITQTILTSNEATLTYWPEHTLNAGVTERLPIAHSFTLNETDQTIRAAKYEI